jgi:diguanylate cyclase (GGDEF)-like protein
MEDKKNKRQLFEIISSLRKRVKGLLGLRPKLKRKEVEFKELEKNFESRINLRTSAERVIKKLLHADIAQRKQLEKVVQDSLDYANGIVATIRDPLIVLDSGLNVISANHAFYRTFNVKLEDTERQHIYDLGDHQWNIPKLRVLLEDILPHATHFDKFEVEHDFPGIGKRTMLLNARKIYRRKDQTQLILLAIEDITERVLMENRLKMLASHDELTSCVNFRSIMELLENEIARSLRYKSVFTVVMIDIDQFKKINDEYGHMAGSETLASFAKTLKNSVRNVDIVGRYGGDEFVIVLPETDSSKAMLVLDRVRDDLGRLRIISSSIKSIEGLEVKFSAGVAVFPRNAKSLEELLRAADGALRQAKREGKNRVVLAPQIMQEKLSNCIEFSKKLN